MALIFDKRHYNSMLLFFFKGCGLCAAPLFVSFDEGSFEGVEKKRKETKRNKKKRKETKKCLFKIKDPWKRNEKGQIFSLKRKPVP